MHEQQDFNELQTMTPRNPSTVQGAADRKTFCCCYLRRRDSAVNQEVNKSVRGVSDLGLRV